MRDFVFKLNTITEEELKKELGRYVGYGNKNMILIETIQNLVLAEIAYTLIAIKSSSKELK